MAGSRIVPDVPSHIHKRPAPMNEHGQVSGRPGEAWCPRVVCTAQAIKRWAEYVRRGRVNEIPCSRIASGMMDASTNFLGLAGISTSLRQRLAVDPPQIRTSLDHKTAVFHKTGNRAAARRIGGGTAGLFALSAY